MVAQDLIDFTKSQKEEMIRHNCGLVVTHTLHDAYSFIMSLQHRGREAAGIAAIGDTIDVLKWVGKVDKFSLTNLHNIFPAGKYHTFFAHVRYATRGRKDKILQDAHPQVIGGTVINNGNHILVRDCEMVAVHNGQIDLDFITGIDTTKLKTDCDTEAAIHMLKYGDVDEFEFIRKVPGSYTMAVADKVQKKVYVLRDRFAIKPGVLGKKDGKHCVASENIAFSENGAELVETLSPGSVYYIHPDGKFEKKKAMVSNIAQCFFEWNYIASVKSSLNGRSVQSIRQRLGKQLAEEFNFSDVDFVSFVPNSPKYAAIAYSQRLKKEFVEVFYKINDERSFLGSTKEDRAKSIDQNLYLVDEIIPQIQGKTIVIIDDSTIRGNNAIKVRNLLYDVAKVKKVYLLNYTPKIGIIGEDGEARGCVYGVDIPPDDDFIVRQKIEGGKTSGLDYKKLNRTDEEIGKELDVDIRFLSVKGMLESFESYGVKSSELCTFCIGGSKPFK